MSLAFAVGDVLAGKYRVEGVIGRGGMGVVVAAMHLQLERRVALKFLHPEVARKPELVERFAREARAASKIESEHVARVLDVGTLENGAPFMVMEHLAGAHLSVVVKRRGALPVAEAVEYVLQACEALAEAHVAGIVHRDLKPANLFLAARADGSPSIKILDFGISKVAAAGDEQGITRTSAMMGSPNYMAPEQLKSARDVDARTDIWALGIILHELLTGEGAFRADTVPELYVAILQKPPTPLRARRPDAPPAMEALILRCLEKDPARRFATVAQLAAAFGDLAPPRARPSVYRIARVIGGRAPTAFAPTVFPPEPPAAPAAPAPALAPPPSPPAPPAPRRPTARRPRPPPAARDGAAPSQPPARVAPSARPAAPQPALGGGGPPRPPAPMSPAPRSGPHQAPPVARAALARPPPPGSPYPHPHPHAQPYPYSPPAAGYGPPVQRAEPRLSSAAIVLIVLIVLLVLGGGSCVACFLIGTVGREGQSSAAR